jgi:protease I
VPIGTRFSPGTMAGKREVRVGISPTRELARDTEGAEMAGELQGKKVAFLVANEGIEQVELTEPRKALEGAGAETVLIAPEAGEAQAFNHLDKADAFPVDVTTADADAAQYDGLVLPGGVANPDNLRTDDAAVGFVRAFFDAGKPVAAICHAPWTLIEADVVEGRKLTSWPSLQTDLRNAGAEWVDEEVVVDSGLVTSRNPGDLPAFNAKAIEEIAEGEHAGQRERTHA